MEKWRPSSQNIWHLPAGMLPTRGFSVGVPSSRSGKRAPLAGSERRPSLKPRTTLNCHHALVPLCLRAHKNATCKASEPGRRTCHAHGPGSDYARGSDASFARYRPAHYILGDARSASICSTPAHICHAFSEILRVTSHRQSYIPVRQAIQPATAMLDDQNSASRRREEHACSLCTSLATLCSADSGGVVLITLYPVFLALSSCILPRLLPFLLFCDTARDAAPGDLHGHKDRLSKRQREVRPASRPARIAQSLAIYPPATHLVLAFQRTSEARLSMMGEASGNDSLLAPASTLK